MVYKLRFKCLANFHIIEEGIQNQKRIRYESEGAAGGGYLTKMSGASTHRYFHKQKFSVHQETLTIGHTE